MGLPPPLQQRPIRAVYDDSAERLWPYDEATIYVRRGGRWHTRDVDASGQATSRAFAQTENGSVWIGTDGEGLFRVRGDTVATAQVRQITSADGLPSDRIRSVHEDRQGRLWVGIGDRGLVRLDRQGTLPLKDDILTTPLPPAAIERVATGDTTYTTVPGDTCASAPSSARLPLGMPGCTLLTRRRSSSGSGFRGSTGGPPAPISAGSATRRWIRGPTRSSSEPSGSGTRGGSPPA